MVPPEYNERLPSMEVLTGVKPLSKNSAIFSRKFLNGTYARIITNSIQFR